MCCLQTNASLRPMADVRCGFIIAAEQALSGHLDHAVALRFEAKWLPNNRKFCNTHSEILIPQSRNWNRT